MPAQTLSDPSSGLLRALLGRYLVTTVLYFYLFDIIYTFSYHLPMHKKLSISAAPDLDAVVLFHGSQAVGLLSAKHALELFIGIANTMSALPQPANYTVGPVRVMVDSKGRQSVKVLSIAVDHPEPLGIFAATLGQALASVLEVDVHDLIRVHVEEPAC